MPVNFDLARAVLRGEPSQSFGLSKADFQRRDG